MKGKQRFTQAEANRIIALIKQKLLASADEQKRIRNQIRKIGFFASDFGIGGGYTVDDFRRVAIIDGKGTSTPAPQKKPASSSPAKITTGEKKRDSSDESYVIDLCDEVLKQTASRQHKFDFLLGDAGTRLPVDAYYPSLNTVVEYRERQHTERVKFFDRRQTVSGVGRGEQRKLYDQRRRKVLPQNGINLVEMSYSDFNHTTSKRIIRDKKSDSEIVKQILKKGI